MALFCTEMKGLMGQNSRESIGLPPCQLNSRRTTLKIAASLLLLAGLIKGDQASQGSEGRLKGMSLEQLGNIEVTTASKQPVKVSRTPAASSSPPAVETSSACSISGMEAETVRALTTVFMAKPSHEVPSSIQITRTSMTGKWDRAVSGWTGTCRVATR